MSENMEMNQELSTAIQLLEDNKAENIVVVNTGSESPIADWIIICEGTNFVHVRAIADNFRDHFKKEFNVAPLHSEGKSEARWVLLDYADMLINVMLPELREHYKLEELWSEYPQKQIS